MNFCIERMLCGVLMVGFLGGCATSPSAPRMSRAEVDACRQKVREAMVFRSRPLQSRLVFQNLASRGTSAAMQAYMPHYWETLGVNVSSVVLMLDPEITGRISLQIAENDPAEIARHIESRLRTGRSVLDRQDVVSISPAGEFLKVTLHENRIASGWFYVRCGEIEGRAIGEQTFVDFTTDEGETRKLSLQALVGLMDHTS